MSAQRLREIGFAGSKARGMTGGKMSGCNSPRLGVATHEATGSTAYSPLPGPNGLSSPRLTGRLTNRSGFQPDISHNSHSFDAPGINSESADRLLPRKRQVMSQVLMQMIWHGGAMRGRRGTDITGGIGITALRQG